MNIETLRKSLPLFNPGDRKFAESLIEHHDTKGYLTPRQEPWVEKLIARVNAPPQTVGNPDALLALFDKASKAKLWPSIVFQVKGIGEVRMYCNAAKADRVIRVVEHTGAKRYFGEIRPDGTYTPKGSQPMELLPALQKIATDPVNALAAHGREICHCCFCWSPLNTPESTHAGYGPVCAKNWGLPWGKTESDPNLQLEDLGL